MNIKKLCIILIISISGSLIFGCTENQGIIKESISLKCEDGSFLKAEVIVPENYKDKKLPLVTLSHGFGGNMNSAGGEQLAEALAKAGFTTIRMDYNHYQNKKMTEQKNSYTVKSMEKDQIKCINYMIETFNSDKTRIGLYGRSLGGRVAMTMANESSGGYKYRTMVLIAPAGDKDALIYYMGGENKWTSMKENAFQNGNVTHQGLKLTYSFFEETEAYIPSDNGFKFKHPVLVIYNTLDGVVLPKSSLKCADCYDNSKTIEVTSKNGHGYEMSYKKSDLKIMLTKNIVNFFEENI